MSVRVNLLPEATKERSRAARQRAVAASLGVVLLGGLGAAYWWASGQVTTAEQELAEAEVLTATLRQEADELSAFRDLEERRDAAVQALTVALAGEVSIAGILQDFAAVVPPDAEFTTLNVRVQAAEGSPGVGSFTLTGRTLASHAPGVERTILQLEKVSSFVDLYLNSSALDEVGDRVATFTLDGNVGPEAATQRYAEGLPEVLR